MRFIIPYFAGAASTFLVIGGFIGGDPNQLGIGIALAIIITGGAIITCLKRHKRNQKGYNDGFRRKIMLIGKKGREIFL